MPKAPFRVVRDVAPDGALHDTPGDARRDAPRDALRDALRGAVVAIGNFDGVHEGHRAVIATAMARAASLGRPAAVLTFEPHPRSFFNPQTPLFRLTDEAGKLRLLAATGIDGAIVLRFDRALADLTAGEFVERVLLQRFGIGGAVVGFNFHFGKNRAGTPAFLSEEGKRHGFTVDIAQPLEQDGRPVSSGPIRTALVEGRLDEANGLLGYPWFVSGAVIHGDKRGRELGFPTANLQLDASCGLRHGIYAVRVAVDGKRHDGVASFGRRPMFDNGTVLLEVFLFDFSGDLYGKAIDVAFIAFLRDEEKFASLDDLIRQMHMDVARARDALTASGGAFPPI